MLFLMFLNNSTVSFILEYFSDIPLHSNTDIGYFNNCIETFSMTIVFIKNSQSETIRWSSLYRPNLLNSFLFIKVAWWGTGYNKISAKVLQYEKNNVTLHRNYK